MTSWVVPVVLAGCAGWLGGGPAGPGRARLRRLLGPAAGVAAAPTVVPWAPTWAPWAPTVLARAPTLLARSPWVAGVVTTVLVLSGEPGLAVPLVIGSAAVAAPARRRAAAARRRRARLARDVPRAADQMATCLDAGMPPADALAVVCEHLPGPVQEALRPVTAALRAGADPAAAWALLGGDRGDPLQRLARAFVRAATTGTPLARSLTAVAVDERARARWAAEAAARRAGVRAVGPLAVCFLPAFLLLGVVPVVVGVATQVLGRLL